MALKSYKVQTGTDEIHSAMAIRRTTLAELLREMVVDEASPLECAPGKAFCTIPVPFNGAHSHPPPFPTAKDDYPDSKLCLTHHFLSIFLPLEKKFCLGS